VEILLPQPPRRVGALVVTAAAALALGAAAASASDVQPLPQAGWHGRAIREPQKSVATPVSATFSARPSVRQLQRMLIRIGYAPGPVDGIYGVRTRSSVQWFQIKHGLRPSGAVDLATLSALRSLDRTATGDQASAPGDIEKPSPATAPPRPAPLAPSSEGGSSAVLVALVALLAVAALGLLIVALRRARRGVRPQPAAPRPGGPPRAIGFASGRDHDELKRHAVAIQRTCEERGWALTCLVRDGDGRRQRALSFALDQVVREVAPRLVVGRLEHVGSSLREVADVLALCARNHIALVALDVGLDTGTSEGALAARRIVAEADARDRRHRRVRRRRGRTTAPTELGLSSTGGHRG
jgi:DNA invertase Pin-like site-specific DNA recombinase